MHNKIVFANEPVDSELRNQLIAYVYPLIGCMHYVHDNLGPGLPEYIYQEALYRKIRAENPNIIKEYAHSPIFDGEPLESSVRMDLMVPMSQGNVIIECKSITELTSKERYQTFGYLRATLFPIAILVNFGTWPKAQIERYYYSKGVIRAF